MDIQKEKADLKERQGAVVETMNKNIAQRQQLEAEMQELVREAERLNGEARLLQRLSKDGGN
jgi:cell division protein FtsB